MRLVKYPDTFLRDSTEKVEFPLSDENKIIIKNMINLMYQENGIGLAAGITHFCCTFFPICCRVQAEDLLVLCVLFGADNVN